VVKGVGALKYDNLKIKKGVNLLKPIAKQALAQCAEKRKPEIQRPAKHNAR
jgi:hypothetical protein